MSFKDLLIKLDLVEGKETPTIQPQVNQNLVEQKPIILSNLPQSQAQVLNLNTQEVKNSTSVYDLAFEKLNTPEWDLFEFIQTTDAFGQSEQSYKATFSLGSKLNPSLTKDLLIKQCSQYYGTIAESSSAKLSEFKKELEDKLVAYNKLQSEIKDLTEKVEQRTSGLNVFQNKIETIKNNLTNWI